MRGQIIAFLAADALIVAAALLYFFGPRPAQNTPAEPATAGAQTSVDATARDALLRAYREAHQTADVGAAMRLVCQDNADQKALRLMRGSFQDDFQLTLVDVDIVPLEDTDKLQYTIGGVRYVPNLEPIGKLSIKLKTESGTATTTTYVVGVKDGRCMIATAMPVP